jgi:hypothetical protein
LRTDLLTREQGLEQLLQLALRFAHRDGLLEEDQAGYSI